MKKRKLIATRSHKYGTRHLTAGNEVQLMLAPDKPKRAAKKSRLVKRG